MPGVRRKTKKSTAGRFLRVRNDHAREMAEDYTELILELQEQHGSVRPTDLARALGVSHVTVLRTLTRLEKQRWIERDQELGISLTASGRRLAIAARERHAVVVDFLRRIGVPARVAAQDAEGIEHHCSAATLRCLREFLRR